MIGHLPATARITSMRRFFLLTLTLLLAGPVVAQDLAEYPIEGFQQANTGNFWIYRTTVTSGSGSGAPAHYLMHRVVGDTLLDGKRQPLVRSLEMDEAGNELSYSTCALDRESGRFPVYTLLDDGGNQSCKLGLVADVMRPSQYGMEAPKDIRIESVPYRVLAMLYTGGYVGAGSHGGRGWQYERAWDVGTVLYYEATSCPGCTSNAWRLSLVYARVNGVYWGASPGLAVFTVPDPAMPMSADLEIYPNPAPDGFMVDAGPEITTVQIYDMLGREVRTVTGSGQLSIDRGSLAPGLYLVRAGNRTRSVILR